MVRLVKKRDGTIVPFNSVKIQNAIEKAMSALSSLDRKKSKSYTNQIIKQLNEKNIKIPTIEEIQDNVESVLEKNDSRLFKAYSLYRRSRGHAREIRQYFKIKDDLKLSVNALKVLEERYLLKDSKGNIIETPTKMFSRVAKAIANNQEEYETFFNLMKNLEFLPNSPTLMNAGTKLGQLSACFTAEQPIVTAKGIKQIKDIKIGDLVLTASGKFAHVTKTMQRIAKGKYVLNIAKLPNNTLSVTEDHPILSLKNGKPSWVMI